MEDFLSTNAITLGLVIIAVVQGIKEATKNKNTGEESLKGWVTIAVAGFLGLSAGISGSYLGWNCYANIDPLTGLMVGLAASGGITLAKSFTNQTK